MSSTTLVKESMTVTLENEFENYLKERKANATYNGIELDTEGWQKELFGERQKT